MKKSLRVVLLELGSDGQEVAQTLRDKGFKGMLESSTSCPIACYLQSLGYTGVEVSAEEVNASLPMSEELPDGKYEEVCTPSGAASFIHDFDRGEYHDLAV